MATTTPVRTRRALLERELEATRAKLAEAELEVAELPGRIDEEAVAFLREAPTGKPFKLGSGPQRLRAKRDELIEKTIPRLRDDIRALEITAGHASEEEAIERLEEAFGAVLPLADAELAAWQKLGKAWAGLVTAYGAYADAMEAREAARIELYHSDEGLLGITSDQKAELDSAFRPVVEPAPVSILSLLELLFNATMSNEYRGTGARPTDTRRVLPDLLPDLRDKNRRIEFALGEKRETRGFEHGTA